jgi:hypothetical protein
MEYSKKNFKTGKLCIVFLLCASPLIYSQNVIIVSGTDYVTSMKKTDLIKLYQGESIILENKKITFLDHERDTKIYTDFIKQYFDMTPEQMQDFWVKMKLQSGKKAPKFLPKSFLPKALGSIKGSVSYYYEGEVPPNLHKVEIIE